MNGADEDTDAGRGPCEVRRCDSARADGEHCLGDKEALLALLLFLEMLLGRLAAMLPAQ